MNGKIERKESSKEVCEECTNYKTFYPGINIQHARSVLDIYSCTLRVLDSYSRNNYPAREAFRTGASIPLRLTVEHSYAELYRIARFPADRIVEFAATR